MKFNFQFSFSISSSPSPPYPLKSQQVHTFNTNIIIPTAERYNTILAQRKWWGKI